MQRMIRILMAIGIAVTIFGGPAAAEVAPQALVASDGAVGLGDTIQPLSSNRHRVSVPASFVGGPRLFRAASAFADHQADGAADDLQLDKVPDRGTSGPIMPPHLDFEMAWGFGLSKAKEALIGVRGEHEQWTGWRDELKANLHKESVEAL